MPAPAPPAVIGAASLSAASGPALLAAAPVWPKWSGIPAPFHVSLEEFLLAPETWVS